MLPIRAKATSLPDHPLRLASHGQTRLVTVVTAEGRLDLLANIPFRGRLLITNRLASMLSKTHLNRSRLLKSHRSHRSRSIRCMWVLPRTVVLCRNALHRVGQRSRLRNQYLLRLNLNDDSLRHNEARKCSPLTFGELKSNGLRQRTWTISL